MQRCNQAGETFTLFEPATGGRSLGCHALCMPPVNAIQKMLTIRMESSSQIVAASRRVSRFGQIGSWTFPSKEPPKQVQVEFSSIFNAKLICRAILTSKSEPMGVWLCSSTHQVPDGGSPSTLEARQGPPNGDAGPSMPSVKLEDAPMRMTGERLNHVP